jgi:chloramphenicol-sensitive protein RarD
VPESRLSSSGLGLAIAAYGLWGFLPLYFLLLAPSTPVEIVAWRVVLSLAFCVFLLAVTRTFRPFAALLRDRRIMVLSLLAGILIAINWIVYVAASTSGFVVEAALGYFINPIVSITLGVLFLRERLRVGQWVAVAISVVAVLVLAISGGLVWMLMDFGVVSANSARGITYVVEICTALMLGVGMTWSLMSKKITGQVDMDQTD